MYIAQAPAVEPKSKFQKAEPRSTSIHIGGFAIRHFINYAFGRFTKPDGTPDGIERCGYLLGVQEKYSKKDVFRVTHLYIPKQQGTGSEVWQDSDAWKIGISKDVFFKT